MKKEERKWRSVIFDRLIARAFVRSIVRVSPPFPPSLTHHRIDKEESKANCVRVCVPSCTTYLPTTLGYTTTTKYAVAFTSPPGQAPARQHVVSVVEYQKKNKDAYVHGARRIPSSNPL